MTQFDTTFAHPFYFLRHGETDFNHDRRFQGQLDSQLNETGLLQAAMAAEALKSEPISAIITSPLSRARITAETVAAARGETIETDPDLMECHLGIHQGEPYAPWMPDYWTGDYAPEGGEDFWTFRDRVLPAMQRIVARGPNCLIVAHGGLWYAARSLIAMEPDIERMPNALALYIQPARARWNVQLVGQDDRFGAQMRTQGI